MTKVYYMKIHIKFMKIIYHKIKMINRKKISVPNNNIKKIYTICSSKEGF